MEILERLVSVLDGCVGLLEVLTLLFDSLAIFVGIKTLQKQTHAAEKLAHHHGKGAIKKPSWWPVLILGVFAALLTTLTLWKWTRGLR